MPCCPPGSVRPALDLRHVAPGVYFPVVSADGVDVGARVVVTR